MNGRRNMAEDIDVARHDSDDLFDVGFWLACEHEAAQIVRALTGADDGQATRRT